MSEASYWAGPWPTIIHAQLPKWERRKRARIAYKYMAAQHTDSTFPAAYHDWYGFIWLGYGGDPSVISKVEDK